jgi:hypothetical protein
VSVLAVGLPPVTATQPAEPVPGGRLVLLAGLVLIAGLGWWGVASTDLGAADAYGLLSALSGPTLAALGLTAVLLGIELARPGVREARLALLVIALIGLMFSLPTLAGTAAGPPTGYLHAGFTEYISQHGSVPAGTDARFSWPAFFAAAGVLVSISGLHDARPLLAWAPVLFELLALAPVVLLARSLSRDLRTAWLAVVLFFCGVWFGQDYFAPQAVAYVLFLSVLGLLAWLIPAYRRMGLRPDRIRRDRPRPGLPDRREDLTAGQHRLLQLVLLGLVAGLVVSHQLTPVALIGALFVLSVLAMTRARLLWLSSSLLFVLWFSYGAADFWAGHLDVIFGDIGRLGDTLRQGVSNRLGGGAAVYTRMQYLRMGLCLLFLSGGLIGAWWMRRSRVARLLAALSAAPFALAAVQSYGGEVLLRCFLYALPFLAILSAHAVLLVLAPLLRPGRHRDPAGTRAVPLRAAATFAVLVLAGSLALITTHGLNTAFERVSASEVAGAQFVEAAAAPGSVISVLEPVTPLAISGVGRRRVVDRSEDPRCPQLVVLCTSLDRPQLVYLSRGQEAYGQLRRRLPPGWLLGQGLSQLLATGEYTVAWRGTDAVVLVSTRYPVPAVRP